MRRRSGGRAGGAGRLAGALSGCGSCAVCAGGLKVKKVLLVGNPNVGKSVIFNRLSGARAVVSNYPGTTVDFTRSFMRVGGEEVEIIDLPGTFSLEPKDKAEEVACRILEKEKGRAVVVSVIDATAVERGLYLTLELIERGYPVIVALNMSDLARDRRIKIDARRLEEILGVPVVETVATTGSGLRELVARLPEARPADVEEIMRKVGMRRRRG